MGKSFNMTGGSGGGGGGISLSSIAITTPPTKTAYQVGDTFDPTGMVVTATYSNGATLVVGGYTVSPQTMTLGLTSVTVSYTEGGVTKTATQAVTVTQYDATLEVTVTLVGTGATVSSVVATNGGDTVNLTYDSGTGKWVGNDFSSGVTWTVTATNSNGGSKSTTVLLAIGTNAVSTTLGVLPSGYTQREYLESTGTQYLVTPINGRNNITIKGKCALNSISENQAITMSAKEVTASSYSRSGVVFLGAQSQFSVTASSVFGTGSLMGISAGVPFEFEAVCTDINPSFKVNGTSATLTSLASGVGYGDDVFYTVFCQHVTGISDRFEVYMSGKLESLGYFYGGASLCSLIPATRDSDDVVGMYDLVSDTFLTNQGTGNFIAGAAV